MVSSTADCLVTRAMYIHTPAFRGVSNKGLTEVVQLDKEEVIENIFLYNYNRPFFRIKMPVFYRES